MDNWQKHTDKWLVDTFSHYEVSPPPAVKRRIFRTLFGWRPNLVIWLSAALILISSIGGIATFYHLNSVENDLTKQLNTTEQLVQNENLKKHKYNTLITAKKRNPLNSVVQKSTPYTSQLSTLRPININAFNNLKHHNNFKPHTRSQRPQLSIVPITQYQRTATNYSEEVAVLNSHKNIRIEPLAARVALPITMTRLEPQFTLKPLKKISGLSFELNLKTSLVQPFNQINTNTAWLPTADSSQFSAKNLGTQAVNFALQGRLKWRNITFGLGLETYQRKQQLTYLAETSKTILEGLTMVLVVDTSGSVIDTTWTELWTTETSVDSIEQYHHTQFISIPLRVGYQFTYKRFLITPELGLNCHIPIRSRAEDLELANTTIVGYQTPKNSPYRLLNWSAVSSLELQYRVNDRIGLSLSGQYQYQLNPILKEASPWLTPRHQATFQIGLHYRF